MNTRRLFMAMGLVAAVACLPLFGTSGAILSPTAGTVAVNGQPIAAGSAIVAGDLVTTSAAGSARMVLPGGSLIAASNTNFRMESVNGATEIRLNSGMVQVSGYVPVAVGSRTVVPTSSAARFNVYDLTGKVYVEAVSGSVAVKSANGSYTVNSGSRVSFNDAPAAAANSSAAAGGGAALTGISTAVSAVGAVASIVAAKKAGDANTAANAAQSSVSTISTSIGTLSTQVGALCAQQSPTC
ncbi:MAG: hypothetical protein ACRD1Y_00805 [Terriglobales bacterium]